MSFSCANAKKIKSVQRRSEVSILSTPNFIINTWIIWRLHRHTHTHSGATSLQYLRCSLPHPHGSRGGVGSNRQQWMPGLAQLYKQSCKEKSPATVAQSFPVLIPHCLHARQTHSSHPCIAFHTPKFNLAGKWTRCITSPGWKFSRHCSPPIILFLRQHDGCVIMYNRFASHFLQNIFLLLAFSFRYSLKRVKWTHKPEFYSCISTPEPGFVTFNSGAANMCTYEI